jgi:hypothetical protein
MSHTICPLCRCRHNPEVRIMPGRKLEELRITREIAGERDLV